MKEKRKWLILLLGCVLLMLVTGCGKDGLTVDISLPSGEYTGEQEITLSNSGNYDIYYTLDGSDPTQNGNLYDSTKKIYLNFDATLKACSKERQEYGPITEAKYTIKEEEKAAGLTPEERHFLSNVSGQYQFENMSYYINSRERMIDWNDGTESGTSEIIKVTVPEDFDGYHGSITYNNNKGEAVTLEIDMLPMGDNAVYFNGVNFSYLGD